MITKIKCARIVAGKTVREVADAVHVSVSKLFYWESGRAQPSEPMEKLILRTIRTMG